MLLPNSCTLICLIAFLAGTIGASYTPPAFGVEPPPRAVQMRIFELMKLGKSALGKKEYEDALTYFNAVLELYPDFPEAHFRIGSAYVNLKEYPKSIAAIKRSLELTPNNTPIEFALASVYKMANRLDDAIGIYEKIAEEAKAPQFKARAEQNLQQIHNLIEERRIAAENALFELEQASAQDPSNIALLLKLAERYLKHEKLEEAEKTYLNVVEIDPSNAIAHLRLAEFHYKAERIDEAFAELEILLADFPTGVTGRATIDLTLKLTSSPSVRNTERSAELLRALLDADPNNTAAHTSLGIYHQLIKEFEQAEKHFLRTTELEPDNPLTHANLASAYVDMARPDKAIQELEKVISLEDKGDISPQNRKTLVALYIKLGKALIKVGEMSQGNKAFDYALAGDPDNPAILVQVAEAYFSINALPYAIKHFEKALELAPEDARTHYYLGLIYDESGELDKAIDIYSKLIGLDTPQKNLNAEIIANKLALILAKKAFNEGHLEQAEEILTNTIIQTPEEFWGHFYLALIYESTNRRNDAVKEYEEAVRINPNHSGARLQLGHLYEQMWLEEDALAQYNMVARQGGGNFVERAERAQMAITKKINGLSYSLTQAMTFDSNSNLNETNPLFGYRSSVSFNATYRYKISPNARFRLMLGPSYQGHVTQSSDMFSLSLSPSITLGNGSEGVELSYRHISSSGFLQEETKISETNSYRAELRSEIAPLWGDTAPATKNAIPDPWSVRASLSFRDYDSVTNPLFSAHTYMAQLFLSYRNESGNGVNLGYDYTRNLNESEEGSDNAYSSHGLSAGMSFSLVPGWMSDINYSIKYTDYSNPDSHSENGTHRKSMKSTLSFSLSHFISREVRVFGGYNWTHNRANLPININLSDIERIAQSSSLGDYSTQTITIGLGLSF